ncbi:amidohydrolase [Rapidithrix thailandica]|uniref:Omega-amidase YafV n=1 Tax=Rapidithrix thailandica TaxID=413964 RepID=A0AAW9S6A0_9BACT
MADLKITLIQTALHWENKTANLAHFEELFWQITPQSTDLIVLPEMFSTGFSMNAAQLAEPINLQTFKWLKQMAAQSQAVVVGSYIVVDAGHYFNRLIWMRPDGSYSFYDKRHLFRMAQEHKTYAGGTQKLIEEINGWKVCPLICYDLRFPVWSRSTPAENYDCLIYLANWPAARANAWNCLLPARAIENLCYTVGVNRIGIDGKGITYAGDSKAYDFKGELVEDLRAEDCVRTISLSGEKLMQFRQKFPAHLDSDRFHIQP